MRGDHKDFNVPEKQADAYLDQANPVSGTKYTVLEDKNLDILTIAIQCTWTVQPTPLEIHITIDGQTHKYSFTDPVTGTWYYAHLDCYAAADAQPLSATLYWLNFIKGRDVKIEAEITGGTVQNMKVRVKYTKA